MAIRALRCRPLLLATRFRDFWQILTTFARFRARFPSRRARRSEPQRKAPGHGLGTKTGDAPGTQIGSGNVQKSSKFARNREIGLQEAQGGGAKPGSPCGDRGVSLEGRVDQRFPNVCSASKHGNPHWNDLSPKRFQEGSIGIRYFNRMDEPGILSCAFFIAAGKAASPRGTRGQSTDGSSAAAGRAAAHRGTGGWSTDGSSAAAGRAAARRGIREAVGLSSIAADEAAAHRRLRKAVGLSSIAAGKTMALHGCFRASAKIETVSYHAST